MTQVERHDALRYAVDGLVAEARAFRKRNTLIYTDLILAFIAERLADVTEEMVEAWEESHYPSDPDAVVDWRAMLSASALVKGEKP